nr:unnamed protein product [Digitaria exilis]
MDGGGRATARRRRLQRTPRRGGLHDGRLMDGGGRATAENAATGRTPRWQTRGRRRKGDGCDDYGGRRDSGLVDCGGRATMRGRGCAGDGVEADGFWRRRGSGVAKLDLVEEGE